MKKVGLPLGILLILAWCLLPVAWIISLSFKSEESITAGNPGFLPSEGTFVGWENYDKVLTDPLYDYFPRAIINSIGMNILLFVPFGVFLFLMIRQEIITVLFAFLFSATIEFLQYTLPIGRISNVDDVILNTLGGIIGMLVGVIVLKFGIVYNRVRKGR